MPEHLIDLVRQASSLIGYLNNKYWLMLEAMPVNSLAGYMSNQCYLNSWVNVAKKLTDYYCKKDPGVNLVNGEYWKIGCCYRKSGIK